LRKGNRIYTLLDNLWNKSEEKFSRLDGIDSVYKTVHDFSGVDDHYRECLNRGGVHVFSKALRIFGLTSDERAQNIVKWNNPNSWKKEYKTFFADAWAFAEDVFGCQYLFDSKGVIRLDIETGELTSLCAKFTEWIALILDEPNFYSGASIAKQWSDVHPEEPLTGKYHLSPITPFVCGGTYDLDNFFRVNSVENLQFKANFANQIKDLPDGSQIKFSFE
jgi:hypothetical protein